MPTAAKTRSPVKRNKKGHFIKVREPRLVNTTVVPQPTLDEQKEGIMYLYGLRPIGMLTRVVVYKIKNDEIIDIMETVETTTQLQIQHIAQAINVPGYAR